MTGRQGFAPRIAGPCPPPLRLALLALTLGAAIPAQAGPLAVGPDCGPDAFSTAEVIEHRPPHRGPLTAVPQTLCADLAPQAPAPVDIHLYPSLIPPVGRQAPGDPYEGGRRGPFPRP